MRLIDLNPELLGRPYIDSLGKETWTRVNYLKYAKGVLFLCPTCYEKNGGPVGAHGVVCWNGEISQDYNPKPGRWNLLGTSLDDLTLTGANSQSSSIRLEGGCGAHFYIENGEIIPA